MKPMDSLKKPAMMVRLRNSKGFSLIEMAIVLVIIGIIIGAIIKGQDLIANSQAKKAVSAVSTWRTLAMAFYDRNGRWPGDQLKNGLIGDQAGEQTAPLSAIAEMTAAGVMQNAPPNPIIIGSTSFWVYFGSVATASSGVRNAILVCGTVNCLTSGFTNDQLEIIKAMDTAFDGSADAGLGQFRAVALAAPPLLQPPVPALAGTFMSASFSGAGIVPVPDTTAGLTTPWDNTASGAVWLFDKPF